MPQLVGWGSPSGIVGTVVIGLACPVESLDHPCPPHPIQARLRIGDDAGRLVLDVEAEADGTFQVELPPGIYTPSPASPTESPFPRGPDQRVSVLPGEFTTITHVMESGIRWPCAAGVVTPLFSSPGGLRFADPQRA